MQTIVAIQEIKRRAEAIGLTLSEIAAKAGLSPSTALRIAKGTTQEGMPSTNAKLVAALVAEEERMRAHLAQVPRPDPEEKTDAAA